MTCRRPIRDHGRVEFERPIGRLPITGRHEIEQKPSDDREAEAGAGPSFVVRAHIRPCGHSRESLLDQRRDQSIERGLALRAARIAFEEQPFDWPERRNRGAPPAHANRLRRVVRQFTESVVLIAFDGLDDRSDQPLTRPEMMNQHPMTGADPCREVAQRPSRKTALGGCLHHAPEQIPAPPVTRRAPRRRLRTRLPPARCLLQSSRLNGEIALRERAPQEGGQATDWAGGSDRLFGDGGCARTREDVGRVRPGTGTRRRPGPRTSRLPFRDFPDDGRQPRLADAGLRAQPHRTIDELNRGERRCPRRPSLDIRENRPHYVDGRVNRDGRALDSIVSHFSSLRSHEALFSVMYQMVHHAR